MDGKFDCIPFVLKVVLIFQQKDAFAWVIFHVNVRKKIFVVINGK